MCRFFMKSNRENITTMSRKQSWVWIYWATLKPSALPPQTIPWKQMSNRVTVTILLSQGECCKAVRILFEQVILSANFVTIVDQHLDNITVSMLARNVKWSFSFLRSRKKHKNERKTIFGRKQQNIAAFLILHNSWELRQHQHRWECGPPQPDLPWLHEILQSQSHMTDDQSALRSTAGWYSTHCFECLDSMALGLRRRTLEQSLNCRQAHEQQTRDLMKPTREELTTSDEFHFARESESTGNFDLRQHWATRWRWLSGHFEQQCTKVSSSCGHCWTRSLWTRHSWRRRLRSIIVQQLLVHRLLQPDEHDEWKVFENDEKKLFWFEIETMKLEIISDLPKLNIPLHFRVLSGKLQNYILCHGWDRVYCPPQLMMGNENIIWTFQLEIFINVLKPITHRVVGYLSDRSHGPKYWCDWK